MRSENVTLLSESSVPRVWLPFLRVSQIRTSEAFFSPQRSWVSPFRVFLRLNGQWILTDPFFTLALFQKTYSGLLPALQRLDPIEKAVLLIAS